MCTHLLANWDQVKLHLKPQQWIEINTPCILYIVEGCDLVYRSGDDKFRINSTDRIFCDADCSLENDHKDRGKVCTFMLHKRADVRVQITQ